MQRRTEQFTAMEELTAVTPRFRVIPDEEGWPISPGRYGRLEHLGAGVLAAFSDSSRIITRLLTLPGVPGRYKPAQKALGGARNDAGAQVQV